jgi:epsilon-lactone hydrolase
VTDENVTGKGMTMASQEAQATFDIFRQIRDTMAGASPSLDEIRAGGEMFGEMTGEPNGVATEDVDVDGVPGRWIVPAGAPSDSALLYLHGGGYMACSVSSHQRLIGHLSAAVGCRALAIDYRRTPEFPHPAQVDDAARAYRYLLGQGLRPDRLAIGGDSAGGHLTMTTLLRLRADDTPLPAAAVLLSPWIDLESGGDSMRTRAEVDLLITSDGGKMAVDHLLAGGDPRDPAVAPLHADLSGLPPIYIQVGDHEVLLDDSTRLADRLRAAGGDVRLDVFPEMQHVFQVCAGRVPEADEAIGRIGSWLAPRLRLR